MQTGKKFGLILPNKSKAKLKRKVTTSSVFDSKSTAQDRARAEIHKQQQTAADKLKQLETEALVSSELAEAFDYDKWKEEETAQIATTSAAPKKESRYIATLKRRAAERERYRSRVYERKLLKEREQEDEMFGDKEKFMTSAYKKKLAEDAAAEEEEKRKELENVKHSALETGSMHNIFQHMYRTATGQTGGNVGAAAVHSGQQLEETTSATPAVANEEKEQERQQIRAQVEPAKPMVTEQPAATKANSKSITQEETAATPMKPTDEQEAAAAGASQRRQRGSEDKAQPQDAKRQKIAREAAIAAARERARARKAAKKNSSDNQKPASD